MPSLQNISNLYYLFESIQLKEFVMRIDTHTLQRMFTSIQQGRPIGTVDGFVIQHETMYNGQETRYSLRCITPTTKGKLVWQVWMIPNRKPTIADIDLTCKNRSFNRSQLHEHDGLWFFDPTAVITPSPVLNHGAGFGTGIVGGMYPPQHPNRIGFFQPGAPGFTPNMPGYQGPGDMPQHTHLSFPGQQRMDQVGGARQGTFTFDPKHVAKQMRSSMLTADGSIELNRLVLAFNRELVLKSKWVINEDRNELVNTYYGDPQFASASDRIIAFKILLDIPVAQGFIVVASDMEEFTITVRVP